MASAPSSGWGGLTYDSGKKKRVFVFQVFFFFFFFFWHMLAQEMHERTLELGPDATSLLKVLVPSLCLLLESNFSSAIVLASSSLVGLSLSAAKRLPFYRGPILRSIAVACKQIDGDTPDSVPSSLESLFSALWTCCGEAAMQHDWTALKSVPFVSKVLSPPPLA